MIERSQELTEDRLRDMRGVMDRAGYSQFSNSELQKVLGYVLYDDETNSQLAVSGYGNSDHPFELAVGVEFYRVEEFLGKLAMQRESRIWFKFNEDLYSIDPVTGKAQKELPRT